MKLPPNAAGESYTMFKCDQCNYINQTENDWACMKQKHRISQGDGIDDSNEENTKDTDIVTLELDDTGGIVGPDLLPNTLTPSKVLHPKAGIGHLQQEYSRTSDGDTFVN